MGIWDYDWYPPEPPFPKVEHFEIRIIVFKGRVYQHVIEYWDVGVITGHYEYLEDTCDEPIWWTPF